MGLPGVGKSTILKSLIERNPNIKVVNYGDLVLSSAKEKFGVENRDKINSLSIKDHLILQKEAIKKISNEIKKIKKENPSSILILDTHAVLRKPDGYLPGLAPDIFNLPIEAFIFIDAPTKEILERREKDRFRKRPTMEEDEINKLREISISFINQYSTVSGKQYFILINKKGKINETVNEAEKIINRFM